LTTFLLVRHGQTEWNRVVRFRGRANLDLDETGLRQARAVARSLARWQPVAVYTSPLQRAWRTAWAIGQHLGLPVHPWVGLIDIDYGEWQGLSPEEARERYRSLYSRWQHQPHTVHFPRGESLPQVQQRAAAALMELAPLYPEQAVVVVSHEVVCKCLLCWALGLDLSGFWRVRQDVAAVNVIEFREGRPVVALLNHTCHLKDLA